jgi:hypothetical protein
VCLLPKLTLDFFIFFLFLWILILSIAARVSWYLATTWKFPYVGRIYKNEADSWTIKFRNVLREESASSASSLSDVHCLLLYCCLVRPCNTCIKNLSINVFCFWCGKVLVCSLQLIQYTCILSPTSLWKLNYTHFGPRSSYTESWVINYVLPSDYLTKFLYITSLLFLYWHHRTVSGNIAWIRDAGRLDCGYVFLKFLNSSCNGEQGSIFKIVQENKCCLFRQLRETQCLKHFLY